MKRVLLVEDEANLLAATVRGLRSLPDVEVQGVSTVAAALEFLARQPVDVVILDMNLPGGSGLDVYDEILRSPRPVPVIVTTAYRSSFKADLDRHAGLIVLEKPVPLDTLSSLVEQQLALPPEPASSSAFQIVDYLQLAGLGQHSLVLTVDLESGRQGHIDIVEGHVWNVFVGQSTSNEALEILLRERATNILNAPLRSLPQSRQMCERPEALLMEVAKGFDEIERATERPATPVFPAGSIACEEGWYKGHAACWGER